MNSATNNIKITVFQHNFLKEMENMFEPKTYAKIEKTFIHHLDANIILPEPEPKFPSYTVDEFINNCCDIWHTTIEKVTSKCREADLVVMRYCLIFFIKYKYKLTHKRISEMFYKRDHTNVTYALLQVNAWMKNDDVVFLSYYNQIKAIYA